MQLFRSARWLMLALLFSLIPAMSHAQFGLTISVDFAPPELPVYVQPHMPGAKPDVDARLLGLFQRRWGLLLGSRRLGSGAYQGALWTPPYWGW